jgi:hypothetical protein
MARINWDARGERYFEIGVDRGVLYLPSVAGVPWTGLTAVNEEPTGAEERSYYLDGLKYLNLRSAEEFEATIEAFNSPAEFNVCDGTVSIHNGLFATQQPRKSFGLSYRTLLGNDLDGMDHAYKIHLVYNALAAPATRNNTTLSDSVDPAKFSWKITTLPPPVTGVKRTAHFVIDSRTADPAVLAEVEDFLYGTTEADAALPTPDELIAIFAP